MLEQQPQYHSHYIIILISYTNHLYISIKIYSGIVTNTGLHARLSNRCRNEPGKNLTPLEPPPPPPRRKIRSQS
ncbi:hypothetical protein Hanom_Chr14g01298971 [Helianthus anomalus]